MNPVQPMQPASTPMQPAQFAGAQPQPGAAPKQPGGAMPAGKPPVEAFQRLVMAGAKALYTPAVARGIAGRLSTGPEQPADEISDITVLVVSELLRKSRGKPPARALMPSALAIMGMIVEIADAAGVVKREPALLQEASAKVIQKMMQLAQTGAFNGSAPGAGAQPAQAAGVPPEEAAFESGFNNVTAQRAPAAPGGGVNAAFAAGFRGARPAP